MNGIVLQIIYTHIYIHHKGDVTTTRPNISPQTLIDIAL